VKIRVSHTQLRQLAGFVGDLKHFADYLIITYIELTLFIFKNNSYILKKITFADCHFPSGGGTGVGFQTQYLH